MRRDGYRNAARRSSQSLQPRQQIKSQGAETKRIRTGIGGVLDRMVRWASGGGEERVVRKTVEKRDFFHDLENRALDRRGIRIREGVEVDRDDGNPIRELF